jgi:hypothetical protein
MELLTRPTLYPRPPLIESADAHRTAIARCGLLAASQARGIDYPIADEAVTNLLADLRHFCAARRIDFERCARLASIHFENDIGGGPS